MIGNPSGVVCRGCGLAEGLRWYTTKNNNEISWCEACGTMMVFWDRGATGVDYTLPTETSKPALLMTEKVRLSLSGAQKGT